MRRETQHILLVLLGGALLKLALTGSYLRYVKASLQPWLIITGVIMIALAVVAIVSDLRTAKTKRLDADQHSHGGSAHSSWLLLLPVFAVFLISPPPLGSDTVNKSQRNIVVAQPESDLAPLPTAQAVPISMSEFAMRTTWDTSGSLNNRTVKLTGFIARKEESVYLARLAISCCAADASAIKVLLSGQDFTALPTDQWVEIIGRVVPGSATKESGYVPTLTVENYVAIPTPEDTYE